MNEELKGKDGIYLMAEPIEDLMLRNLVFGRQANLIPAGIQDLIASQTPTCNE